MWKPHEGCKLVIKSIETGKRVLSMHRLIIVKKSLSEDQKQTLSQTLGSQITASEGCFEARPEQLPDVSLLQAASEKYSADIYALPETFEPSKVKLVVSDMDSTLINIECVDEIADFAGVKPEVSAVTEAAMRGELDFAGSLLERVKLLSGLDEFALQRVYDERLQLNPGAEEMLAGLKAQDIKFALVSGGFTFFTDRLKARLGLDYALSNTLEIIDGKLTGRVTGDIVGAEAKAEFLLAKCEELNILPSQALAVGDGANDLKMMAVAGLGVAYHAKPKVQQEADCAINYSGLDGLLPLILKN